AAVATVHGYFLSLDNAWPNCLPPRARKRQLMRVLRTSSVSNVLVCHSRSGGVTGLLGGAPGYREEVDEIAVRIAEQHGAIAPRLRHWLKDKSADKVLKSDALAIDVIDLKIKDHRAVCARSSRSSTIKFDHALMADCEIQLRSVELGVAVIPSGRHPGEFPIETGQAGNVLRNDSRVSKFHVGLH